MKKRVISSDTAIGILAKIIVAVVLIAIIGVAVLTRYYMAGGDWNCAIAQDPALCKVIKEFNE